MALSQMIPKINAVLCVCFILKVISFFKFKLIPRQNLIFWNHKQNTNTHTEMHRVKAMRKMNVSSLRRSIFWDKVQAKIDVEHKIL